MQLEQGHLRETEFEVKSPGEEKELVHHQQQEGTPEEEREADQGVQEEVADLLQVQG